MRVILVPLFGADSDASALQVGSKIARRFDGGLIGLFARSDPADVAPWLGEGVSPAILEQIVQNARQEMDRRCDLARHLFIAECTAAGIEQDSERRGTTAARWMEITGRRDEVVAERGRLADLVVFSSAAAHPGAEQHAVLEMTMLGAGRPILLAPAEWTHGVGHRIAIAWNGRMEAARALALAMPLVEAANEVVVLTADTGRTRYEMSEGLAGYLRWHGADCERHRVAVENEPVGAALLRAARKSGADLLVMGGYGRSRLTEFVFGGVTRHMLGHADLPVLMAH